MGFVVEEAGGSGCQSPSVAILATSGHPYMYPPTSLRAWFRDADVTECEEASACWWSPHADLLIGSHKFHGV